MTFWLTLVVHEVFQGYFIAAAILLPLLLGLSALMWRSYRWHLRMARDVPLHDGGVCPWCWRIMQPLYTLDAQPEAHVQCARCKCQHSLDDVQQFWVWLFLDPVTAHYWALEHHPKPRAWSVRWRRSTLQKNHRRWYRRQTGTCIFGVIFVLAGWWYFGPMIISLAVMVLFWAVAIEMITSTVRRRTGSSRYCIQCDYQCAPDSDGNVDATCPECGSDWSQPGSVIVGQKPPLMPQQNVRFGVAIGLIILASISPVALIGTTWTSRILPTNLLLAEVTGQRRFLINEWAVLADRELSDQQRLELARGLLDRREARATLEREANEWFLQEITANRLPAEIAHEFFSGIIVTSLIAPESVKLGERIAVKIDTVNRYQQVFGGPVVPEVFFAGFETYHRDNNCCRQTKTYPLYSFGSYIHSFGMRATEESRTGPEMTAEATHAGPMVVRARYWLAMVPPTPGVRTIQWNDDGTPVFPDGTFWHEKRVIEAIVEVVE